MCAKSILITGCSSGIGHDAAHGLKARGWRVFASCRSQADCDRLIAEGFDAPRIDYTDEASISAGLAEVLEADYLRRRLAVAKLLAGAEEAERWAALLDDPYALSSLRERIELRLRPENPTRFGREEAVALELDLKRVPELTIKVFLPMIGR